ncbi:MAG: FapA family protein [Lachnospiraceae bacterium]|nr:FapA family protein [Lachnospiraceae bacterium]
MTDNDELDLVFESEDLIGLLDDIQEAQNKKEQSQAEGGSNLGRSSGADIASVVSENKAAMSTSSKSGSEAYEDLLGALSEAEMSIIGNVNLKARKIEDYDPEIYSRPQLEQIKLGLDHGLDVSFYDSEEMSFRQMREIRVGLEHDLDVTFYANKYYRDKQMSEIRLGLMENLDVASYARLIYSLPDMHKCRREMFLNKYKEGREVLDKEYMDLQYGIKIRTENAVMRAFFSLTKDLPEDFTWTNMKTILALYGVNSGLKQDLFETDIHNLKLEKEYLVAEGNQPLIGHDGYFEYFHEAMDAKPKIQEDGSIDYRAVKNYATVKAGDKVAVYHEATPGAEGITVSGIEIPGYTGKNLPKLESRSLNIDETGKIYTANKDGLVSRHGNNIAIIDQLEIDGDVVYGKGNIRFDGNIHVHGSVMENCSVEATGGIEVDGFVEGAFLRAGKDIIIRRGVNGNDKGTIESKQNVVAAFLENITVIAGGNVEAGYILNSVVECNQSIKTNGRKSLICGGKVKAGISIETLTIGSHSHVKTEVEVGKSNEYGEKIIELTKRRRKLEHEMERVRDGMDTVLKKFGALTGRTHEMYLKLNDVLEKQKEELALINSEQEKLDKEIEYNMNIFVRVTGNAYANTFLNINGNRLMLQEDKTNVKFYSKGRQVEEE